MNKGDIDI